MDDEVFKMVNIEGQVGFRRAGRFGFFCFLFFFGGGYFFIFFYFVSSNNRKQKYRAGQLAKKFRIREKGREKNKIFRDGEERKEKKVAKKHRSVNT